jgi:hypothetical protein
MLHAGSGDLAVGQVIRFADYEQKSRNPDAVSPRNPADSAIVIILPVIRQFNPKEPPVLDAATLAAELSS